MPPWCCFRKHTCVDKLNFYEFFLYLAVSLLPLTIYLFSRQSCQNISLSLYLYLCITSHFDFTTLTSLSSFYRRTDGGGRSFSPPFGHFVKDNSQIDFIIINMHLPILSIMYAARYVFLLSFIYFISLLSLFLFSQ